MSTPIPMRYVGFLRYCLIILNSSSSLGSARVACFCRAFPMLLPAAARRVMATASSIFPLGRRQRQLSPAPPRGVMSEVDLRLLEGRGDCGRLGGAAVHGGGEAADPAGGQATDGVKSGPSSDAQNPGSLAQRKSVLWECSSHLGPPIRFQSAGGGHGS